MRLRLVLCAALAACAGEDARPPALRLPEGGASVTVNQRSTSFVPGSDGRLRVRLGDVTRGQVQLTLATANGATLVPPTSVREGDAVPFVFEDERYSVVVVELTNRLFSGDHAVLRFTAGRSERSRIEALIAAVERSDVTFLRNGKEHDATAAADHLRRKWRHAGDRELTAEDFIEKIASRSSTTGRPYRIRERDGTLVDARDWLRERLAAQDG